MIDNIGISKLASVYMHPQLILLGLTPISVSLSGLSRPLKTSAPFLPLTTYDKIGVTRVGVESTSPLPGGYNSFTVHTETPSPTVGSTSPSPGGIKGDRILYNADKAYQFTKNKYGKKGRKAF
jgi:hypothetical protein